MTDDEYIELPGDAKIGDRISRTSTRFFLDVANNGADEWDDLDPALRDGGGYYTGHRIVQVDTTVTLTVLAREG